MRFFVKQVIYDNGHVRNTLYTAEQAQELGLHHGYYASLKECDVYVDGFSSKREALKFISDSRRA